MGRAVRVPIGVTCPYLPDPRLPHHPCGGSPGSAGPAGAPHLGPAGISRSAVRPPRARRPDASGRTAPSRPSSPFRSPRRRPTAWSHRDAGGRAAGTCAPGRPGSPARPGAGRLRSSRAGPYDSSARATRSRRRQTGRPPRQRPVSRGSPLGQLGWRTMPRTLPSRPFPPDMGRGSVARRRRRVARIEGTQCTHTSRSGHRETAGGRRRCGVRRPRVHCPADRPPPRGPMRCWLCSAPREMPLCSG